MLTNESICANANWSVNFFFSISGSHVQNIVFYSPQTSEIHQQQDANMSADANAN